MPLLSKEKVLAAKIETTQGTAQTGLTTSDAVYVIDPSHAAEIEITEREDDGSLSHRTGVVGTQKATIKFKQEVKGAGTTGVPRWASVFLPACGMTATSSVFAPVSEVSACKTLTMILYEDGLAKQIHGAMGTWELEAEVGKPAYLSFTFTGVYDAPVDAAAPVPEADTVHPPAFQGSTFTVGGTAEAPISKFTLQQGNKVVMREDATQTQGYISALITERNYTGKIDPEAVLVGTRNVFGELTSGTEQAISLAIGTVANNIITFAAPKAQHKSIGEGNRDGILTHEIDFQLNKSAAAGNDELTITFS